MDVSDAVDMLFAGVVPERIDELKQLWGEQEERVRLVDVPRFLLQQVYGTVQVSELALRQIWLTGYAAWRAIDAYNVPLALAAVLEQPLDIEDWHRAPSQAEKDDAFDHLFDKVLELGKADSLQSFEWPEGVPFPTEGLRITDPELKGTFDLVCIGGAYVFAHEVRHSIFEQVGDQPAYVEDEERECDRWALSLILDDASQYAISNNWPASTVRAKRLLGVLIAKLAILVLTPRQNWDDSGHPPVRERLRMVLDAAVDPVPDWFWTTVSSMFLSFARKLGIQLPGRAFPSTFRTLSYELCDLMRPE
jgi:hypothetical protein